MVSNEYLTISDIRILGLRIITLNHFLTTSKASVCVNQLNCTAEVTNAQTDYGCDL